MSGGNLVIREVKMSEIMHIQKVRQPYQRKVIEGDVR
jgi:hypothetical protein